MPNITMLQYLNGRRWIFMEKGLQVEWNRLYQLLSSEVGSAVVAEGTSYPNLITNDGDGASFEAREAVPISGPFAVDGAHATVAGEKVPPADPGGNSGLTPQRQSMNLPMAGFRADGTLGN